MSRHIEVGSGLEVKGLSTIFVGFVASKPKFILANLVDFFIIIFFSIDKRQLVSEKSGQLHNLIIFLLISAILKSDLVNFYYI